MLTRRRIGRFCSTAVFSNDVIDRPPPSPLPVSLAVCLGSMQKKEEALQQELRHRDHELKRKEDELKNVRVSSDAAAMASSKQATKTTT